MQKNQELERMKIVLDIRKSATENAEAYFEASKELASKQERAKAALAESQKEQSLLLSKISENAEKKPALMKRKREWYEKYHWFFTSCGKLVLAGRDAKQNDMLVGKVMKEEDLFFHADIQGAPAVVLVGGKAALAQEKAEAAQFAACHSSAWKAGASAVDVYAAQKSQLSKHSHGGFVGKGGFAIFGQREWFRSVGLGLSLGMEKERVICVPEASPQAKELPVSISPGSIQKGSAALEIAKILGAKAEEVLLALPSGKFSIRRR
ncbi:MAG: NFACT RNA binding domain-containing protein [Candidatus Micrarchaeota archaeon]|nr:NFACT RNA binding domain-containing protein [Candidatus Micrarchaeota archaeon]